MYFIAHLTCPVNRQTVCSQTPSLWLELLHIISLITSPYCSQHDRLSHIHNRPMLCKYCPVSSLCSCCCFKVQHNLFYTTDETGGIWKREGQMNSEKECQQRRRAERTVIRCQLCLIHPRSCLHTQMWCSEWAHGSGFLPCFWPFLSFISLYR